MRKPWHQRSGVLLIQLALLRGGGHELLRLRFLVALADDALGGIFLIGVVNSRDVDHACFANLPRHHSLQLGRENGDGAHDCIE